MIKSYQQYQQCQLEKFMHFLFSKFFSF